MKNIPLANLEENVTHDKIDFPLNIYYTIFGKTKKDLFLHWHKDMELTYVISGEGLFYTDLVPITVKKGDILIVPPFSLHSGKPLNKFCECKSIVFNLDLLKSNTADSISLKYLNPILEKSYVFPLVISEKHPVHSKILECFLIIAENYENQNWAYELEIKSQLYKVFTLMFREKIIELNHSEVEIETKSDKIKSIIEYVKKHYKSNITLTEVANYLDYSENHFCRFFKAQTGSTFIEYLNSIRLNVSATLLFNTDMSVTDIALESGFDNLSYFIRIFKKKFFCTPFKFRQINKKSNK